MARRIPKSSLGGVAVGVRGPVSVGTGVSSTGVVGVFDGAGLGVGVSPADSEIPKMNTDTMNTLATRYFNVNPLKCS